MTILAWFAALNIKRIVAGLLVALASAGAVYIYDDLVRIPNAQERALALLVARISETTAVAERDAEAFAREIETEIRHADPNSIRCIVFSDCADDGRMP